MRLLPLLFAATSFVLTAHALAQPSAAHATAEEQFKQGRDAMGRQDYKKALELLRASQAAEPGRGKLLNIALCEEQLGLYATALKHFAEVSGQLTADDDRVNIVKQHVAAINPKVSHLKIQIAPGAAAGTTVKLDGEPLASASLGAELAVDPGKHVVEASAPGASDKRYEATVAAGELRAIEAAPIATATATAVPIDIPQTAEPTAASRGIRWPIGLAAVGAGGVSLVIGVATGAAAAAKRSSTAKLCPTPSTCPASVQGDINTYDSLGTASTATFVVGAVLAATGVVLVVTSRRDPKAAPSAWIAPAVGPGALGARGAF